MRGLVSGGLAARRPFISLLGCRMTIVVLMTAPLPLPVRGGMLPHPRPVFPEALNGEYGIGREAVV